MIYELKFSDDYYLDINNLKSNPTLIKKINKFLDEIEEHPTTGTGKPEQLKGYRERNIYSRRIDKQHRLVYEIFEEEK